MYCLILLVVYFFGLVNIDVFVVQMQRKVERLTQLFFEESCGDNMMAAQLLSNFCSQRVVRPYHYVDRTSEAEVIGKNVVDTVSSLKKSAACRKAGGPVDMLRRAIVASASSSTLSNREVARFFGYGNNPARISPLYKAKVNAENAEELAENVAATAIQKRRRDKLTGESIWTRVWHEFTEVKKGQQFRSKMLSSRRVYNAVTRKYVRESKWVRHPKRFMCHRIDEVRTMTLKWPPYLTWRAKYLAKNPKLPADWHVGVKRLYKERCFCVDSEEDVRKCGCEIHLKMQELLAALQRFRKVARKKILTSDPDHSCSACADPDAYFAHTADLSSFSDHLCPCTRGDDGLRNLACVKGNCDRCRNVVDNLHTCVAESDVVEEMPAVKYKWLRPIKICNRNDTEWAWFEKPYREFRELLIEYYRDTYRKHNWVYKRQDTARRECRKRYNVGDAILELDYAAKMTLFRQDAMPCSASKQTSNFVVFAHFAPTIVNGINVTDITEVYTFHSDCLKQDTHSIRRAVTHIIENLKARACLRRTLHIWADGCGAQNKGRKAFRQMSELSMEMQVNVICNFACSHHFAGPWDTEGGRQHRTITQHVRNERDLSNFQTIQNAGDNVRLLRDVMNKAGTPDPPIATQTLWRKPDRVEVATAAAVTAKRHNVEKQARGRSAEEMQTLAETQDDGWYQINRRHIWRIEPCACRRACDCPSDGRLTYKRNENYDSTHIPGTLSTYCYGFFRRAMHVNIRQFTCYCRWCARGEWSKCDCLDVVRHDPSNPMRPRHAGYTTWRDEGWRPIKLTALSPPDRASTRVATQSLAAAREYVRKLAIGATVALRNNSEGRKFWLAKKVSEISVATTNDAITGVSRGEDVFHILWYECVQGLKYKLLEEQTVTSVGSVIVTVSNISWLRTTANRFYLGETTATVLIDIVISMSEM